MAKSMRSKWKRKMRAVKRERYSKKELERLKKTLGVEDNPNTSTSTEVNTSEISDVINFTTVDEIKKKRQQEQDKDLMDQSTIDNIQKFNNKTLRNDNGAYPIWVHPRKIRKCKKSKDKSKSKKSKGKITKAKK